MKYTLILLSGILLCSAGVSTASAETHSTTILCSHHRAHHEGNRGGHYRKSRHWVPGRYVWVHHHRHFVPGHYSYR